MARRPHRDRRRSDRRPEAAESDRRDTLDEADPPSEADESADPGASTDAGGCPDTDPERDPGADEAADSDDDVSAEALDEDDAWQRVRYTVRRTRSNLRLDKYLSGRLGKDHSRNAIQSYIKEGNVTVNARTVKPSYTLRAGDVVDMLLPVIKPREIPPEPIPLDIVYEDDDIIAVNKQADLIIHPARGNWSGTLVNALAYYFQHNWRSISDLPTPGGQAFRPGIVHRLDRDTTGVILVAKSELALWRLGRQFELRKVHKTYTAIVHGLVPLDEDVIDQPLGKHPTVRELYAVHRRTGQPFDAAVKEAVTRYKVLDRLGPVGRTKMAFSLVECYPKTGRTHQIRVHLSSIGHPIVGDKMYGGGPLYRSQLDGIHDRAEGPLITRQALHAHTIEFRHPRSGQEMKLQAPWPGDFTEALSELRARAGSG